jgi:hypothetical protein
LGRYYLNSCMRRSDFEGMENEEASWKRTIVYHAPKEALGPQTDVILARLGYKLLSPEGFTALRRETPSFRADLLLVDERRLVDASVGDGDIGEEAAPIVLLTGKHGATGADPRVVGALKRPAGLHDLYRLVQQIFEETPRSTPRAVTQLLARCQTDDRHWDGRVLSLSENGCLIRSQEPIPFGHKILLEFSLPNAGPISLEAEATYQLLPDVGLVFNTVGPADRETLAHFVTQSLMAA